MNNLHDKLISGILNLFPDQIKVFPLPELKKVVPDGTPSLLHQHFREPLSNETYEKLAEEIAGFLNNKDPQTIYSFFYRSDNQTSAQSGWVISSARLNRSDKGIPKEIVIFSYDLELLGDIKKRLYRVLENDGFFNENHTKVSSLTKREREIVGLVTSGMSSQEIANKIFVSIHTVNTHRRRINDKLAVHNFAGLLRIADIFDLNAKVG
ncbi:MAG: LuxR C-terminal-related transcriptional regulator [Bacteroidota bacterium]|nr:LuxR C-terminal-related transcriptional regulator [Bacteroidota bacterium]